MKKLSALIIAALLAMTISIPVMAEPDNDTPDEDISVYTSEEEATDTELPDEQDDENESPDEEDPEEDSDSTENTLQKKLVCKPHSVEEVGMSIDIPEDMYVLTRNTDEKSSVLKVYKLTKKEMLENFKETNTYLKASAPDFSYDITVSLLQNEDTQTIDNIAVLKDADIQSIVNNMLQQSIYTGCSRTKYNNSLYLSFPMEYESGKTKVKGVQQYTIVNGYRLVISFQSYTGETDNDFNFLVTTVMNNIKFESPAEESQVIAPQPSQQEMIANAFDVRYIYLLISSLIAIIFLTLIIVTAMKYHKSKNDDKTVPAPTEEPEPQKEEPTEKIAIQNAELTEIVPAPTKTEEPPVQPEAAAETTTAANKVEANEVTAEELPAVPEETTPEPEPEPEPEPSHALPESNNQLEIVEIAFRIIPFLKSELDDDTEIWNFIEKKQADMEFFASHAPKNRSNANAFYRVNAGSNLTSPDNKQPDTAVPSQPTIDDEIRRETLETVVGDSKPEMLQFDEKTDSTPDQPQESAPSDHTEQKENAQPDSAAQSEIYRNDNDNDNQDKSQNETGGQKV